MEKMNSVDDEAGKRSLSLKRKKKAKGKETTLKNGYFCNICIMYILKEFTADMYDLHEVITSYICFKHDSLSVPEKKSESANFNQPVILEILCSNPSVLLMQWQL